MKFVLMFVLCMLGYAGAVEVPDSMLTAEQKVKLDAQAKVVNAEANAKVASAYIGLGHEVGVAVNDAMSAITDQANKFAGTEVGRMVKWIIVYKICKGLVLGILSIFLTWLVIVAGNAALYISYVKGYVEDEKEKVAKRSLRFMGDSDNIQRGDLFFVVMVASIVLGVLSTWITLGSIT